MALRRMFCLGSHFNPHLPNQTTYVFFQSAPHANKFPKNVRHFKRARVEEPKFQTEAESPFSNISLDTGSMRMGKLWKPLGFTIAVMCIVFAIVSICFIGLFQFSSSCFVGAAIWQYENMRSHAINMMKQPVGWFQKKMSTYQHKTGGWRKEINHYWNSLSQGEKLFVPICFANILVFLAWRVPLFQPTMIKYFCSNPASQALCWPMVLSTFSHYSALHLFANMYVLHSFSTGAVASLGKEQFLALYLSAGVISSFTSYVYKAATLQPGLSLGASGAIMAVLGYVCCQFPDTKLGIIFLPFLTFSAGTAIKVIVALDMMGVMMGWKLFDHAAHLGGAACGIAWAYWGNEHVWQKREPLLQYWHEFRGSPKK